MFCVVFFFKQKTAYEMRISDWSSDVCSSDLPFKRLRAEHPVYYCPQSRSGPYWSISRYADIVRVDTDPLSFSSSHLHGGVTIEDRVAASFMQLDPPMHTEKRTNVTAVVAPKSRAQMRSEEHTSELQSLMRT